MVRGPSFVRHQLSRCVVGDSSANSAWQFSRQPHSHQRGTLSTVERASLGFCSFVRSKLQLSVLYFKEVTGQPVRSLGMATEEDDLERYDNHLEHPAAQVLRSHWKLQVFTSWPLQ